MKIAILGATSHIAKGLIHNFLKQAGCCMHLYARSPEKIISFLEKNGQSEARDVCVFENFCNISSHCYDAVINCVGVGTLKHIQGEFFRYFTVCEEYDNLVLNYVKKDCPDALYVAFSSGAVYGKHFSSPVNEDTENCIAVNHLGPKDYYSIARINSEAKHRAFSGLRIVDLRVFSYFSRFVDLTEGYFITDVIDCTINHKILETSEKDIIRDYVHPNDLFSMILIILNLKQINCAFDVYSAEPVAKKRILEYFAQQHGLKYRVKRKLPEYSATGHKTIYASNNHQAAAIGYVPKFTSMDTIIAESADLVGCQILTR